MRLIVNGEPREYNGSPVLQEFLRELGYLENQTFAVAINCEFIPKQRYSIYQLKEGDDIEIVAPMQGG